MPPEKIIQNGARHQSIEMSQFLPLVIGFTLLIILKSSDASIWSECTSGIHQAIDSVTRLGNLLHFGQLFKASNNNYFAQIAHILGNFCKGVKVFHFSSEIIFG